MYLSDGRGGQLYASVISTYDTLFDDVNAMSLRRQPNDFSMSCLIEYQAIIVSAIDYHDPSRTGRH
jgi:hypothetical protein